jgi:hypothetical protein
MDIAAPVRPRADATQNLDDVDLMDIAAPARRSPGPAPLAAPPQAPGPVELKSAAPPKGEPSGFDVSFDDVVADAEDDVEEVDSLMLELDPELTEPSAPRPPAAEKPSRPPPLPRK